MIVYHPEDFLEQMEKLELEPSGPAFAKAAMLVEPAGFTINTECAVDNHYMDLSEKPDSQLALDQARGLADLIRGRGIEVVSFPGRHETPDAIFPNNVFGTTTDRFIVGNMFHPGRKKEADRPDIRNYFQQRGYETIDLSVQDCVAELTGTLIIDTTRRIGFCGKTHRVDKAGLQAMHDAFDLKMTFGFGLQEDEYHTNVVMMILASRACVIYPGAFTDPEVPVAIGKAFPGRTLVLSEAEKNAFAGNCIALTDTDLFMSKTGFDALRTSSRETLASWGFDVHSTDLHEIEKAGGSLRCMVAEIF